jgi:hypothetical protein
VATKKRVDKVVPQEDIDSLEAARVWLCNAIAGDNITTMGIAENVTPAIYKITHRKYRGVKSAYKEVAKAGD